MPSFKNPISRPALPFRHEGSPLRHLRDGDSIAHEWQKAQRDNQALRSQGNALERLQRTVAKMRVPKFQMDRWFPFKIYNVPPQLCADPSDSWRTFRVRAGTVAWRSLMANPHYQFPPYENILDITNGGDGVGAAINDDVYTNPPNGFQDDTILSFNQGLYEVVNVPNPGTTGVTSTGSFAEFVLNDGIDSNNERWAQFWIEIVDPNVEGDTALDITPKIMCRMFQFGTGSRPELNLFPDPNVIPIGYVVVRRASDGDTLLNNPAIGFRTYQYIYDHQNNRYPTGYFNTSEEGGYRDIFSTSGMIYRGDWDDDDLAPCTFYPGDVVTTHGFTDETELTTYNALWVFNDAPTQAPEAPGFSIPGVWRKMIRSEFPT